MKKILITLFAFSALTISSCNNGGNTEPKAVLISFFEAISKKDIAAARKLATADSKQMLDLIEMGMKMNLDSGENKFDDHFSNEKVEYGETIIEGDKATVAVKEKTNDEIVNFVLKKENGQWKVAFDMNTMANIGMEKMKGKDLNGSQANLQLELDKLKDMDPDSLKAMMSKGMHMMDSLQLIMKKEQ